MKNHPLLQHQRQRARSSWQIVLNYFLRGLLVLLPIALTAGIIIWLVNLVGGWLHIGGQDGMTAKEFFFWAIAVLALIFFVGFVTRGVVATQILDFFEGIIEKAPGLSFIFGTTRDMTEAFVGEKKKFNKPVVAELSEGVFKMGFLTQESMDIINMPGFAAVYFPYSYGLSGEMMIVETSKIRHITQDSSHVTKFVISGGVANLDGK
ncbi:MAG: DUF502 domain-containing protein [Bacteroidetes bacterium]|nr:DUF502 domain-containing protein [Bacteroidota bacterium]